MIANYTSKGWQIVLQRAHGMLAMQIAAEWKCSERPEKWPDFLLSVACHDDAELEWSSKDVLTAEHGPKNFSDKKFDAEHSRLAYYLALSKSRYIGLLTAHHLSFLYADAAKKDPEAKAFLKWLSSEKDKLKRTLGEDAASIKRDYSLLEWCDALSLLLCQKLVQPEQRGIEISKGPDGQSHMLYGLAETELTVYPWPFENRSFRVSFESRSIKKKLQFDGSEDFRKHLDRAPVTEHSFHFRKAPVPKQPKKS